MHFCSAMKGFETWTKSTSSFVPPLIWALSVKYWVLNIPEKNDPKFPMFNNQFPMFNIEYRRLFECWALNIEYWVFRKNYDPKFSMFNNQFPMFNIEYHRLFECWALKYLALSITEKHDLNFQFSIINAQCSILSTAAYLSVEHWILSIEHYGKAPS